MGYRMNIEIHFSERELSTIKELGINPAQVAVEAVISEVRRCRSLVEAKHSVTTESLLAELARTKEALARKQQPIIMLEAKRHR